MNHRKGDKYRGQGKSPQKYRREEGFRYIDSRNRWIVQVRSKLNGQIKTIGFYLTEEEAKEVYNEYKES